jgi:hypothetical protein
VKTSSVYPVVRVFFAAAVLGGCSQGSEPASPGQQAAAPSAPSAAMQAAPAAKPGGMPKDRSSAAAATAGDATKSFGPFHLSVPQGWTETPPKTNMRKAQYNIGGEAGPAELAVFYFGPDQGGSVEANISRWIGQFKQPESSSTQDHAVRREKQIDGLKVTLLDVKGHFVASMMPGQPAKFDEPDYEMLGAIVETAGGPYFFKMVGPEATVSAAAEDFDRMIDSIARN